MYKIVKYVDIFDACAVHTWDTVVPILLAKNWRKKKCLLEGAGRQGVDAANSTNNDG